MATKKTDLLTTAEAAALIGISPHTLEQHARRGHIRARKFGGCWAFVRGDVERFAGNRRGVGRPRLCDA